MAAPWTGVDRDAVALRTRGRKRDGESLRYCRVCKVYKPDRAHHCRVCGKCTLEMDAHFPYFGICVGLFNHKFFILFQFYTGLSLWMFIGLVLPNLVIRVSAIGFFWYDILTIMALLWSFGCGIIVAFYFAFKMRMIAAGCTTIEYMEQMNRHQSQSVYANVKHFLGPCPFLWVFPCRLGMDSD